MEATQPDPSSPPSATVPTLFANPAACHHAMAMHDLPVLVVVCTNHKWAAVENSRAKRMYPEGYAASAGELTPFKHF